MPRGDISRFEHNSKDGRRDLMSVLLARADQKVTRQVRFKIQVWNITLNCTYAFKRFIDIVGSFFFLVVLSPVFLVTALAIKLDSPGPIFYRQTRVGLYGRHFNFYKFRSMFIDAQKRLKELEKQNESSDGVIFKMKHDPRITRIGRFIRRASIDELPQFLNVLLGDMSLVGPRPPLPSEVDRYTLDERKRLNVTPGITCLWQISGRSDIPFKQQVQLDLEYIRSQSVWRDILIVLKTIPAVISGRGAY